MNDNEMLNERLTQGEGQPVCARSNGSIVETVSFPPQSANSVAATGLDLCQWQVGTNGTFRPAAKTVSAIPAAAYSVNADELGPFLKEKRLLSDDIVELPDTANHAVLRSIRKFWESSDRYRGHGLVFKRGVLLWGPPGGGKTVTVHLLLRDLIATGGIVLFCSQPRLTAMLVTAVRRIEAGRPLIVVLEDVDEIISEHGEHQILSMLDGEDQTDNVVYIATTNYPERLGARIVNRPSRFDERIFVGMPGPSARLTYLKKATSNGAVLPTEDLKRWSADTEGFSIAHLRELVAAVLCLDQPYSEVLERLKSMRERPKESDNGFIKHRLGLT